MSQQNEGNAKGYVCGAADLAEGVAVKIAIVSNVATVVIATAATDKIIGVTQGKYKVGEAASVKLRSGAGTVKVKLGGTVTLGARVTANGSGLLIATTTAADEVVGMAL
jgi:hypothetical protein